MKLKSELYRQEQSEIIQKIYNILELDEDYSTTLYELDHNQEKQKKIMNLIPDIRKYFSFSYINGVREPEKTKRPWLSIIKQLLQLEYKIYFSDYRISIDNNNTKVRTKKYIFLQKTSN